MRRALVAGNWKMHGTLQSSGALLVTLRERLQGAGVEVIVCPPFPYLPLAAERLAGSAIGLGAQNLHVRAEGAFTGEVSGPMLRDIGCSHVIVGHSERRQYCGETDAQVAEKAASALEHGLCPIVCLGETRAEREQGSTSAVIGRQFDAIASHLGPERLRGIVLAYEPVWAIGTGLTATPDQAQEVHAALRARLAVLDGALAREVRVLYGGSVKAANACALFGMPDIDGGLIGGASLIVDEFAAICTAAEGM